MSKVTLDPTFGSTTPDAMWACQCHRIHGKIGCGNTDYSFICYDDGDLFYWPYWSIIDTIPPGWYSGDCLDAVFDYGIGFEGWEAIAEECGKTWDRDNEDFVYDFEDEVKGNLVSLWEYLLLLTHHEKHPLPKGPYFACQCAECEKMVPADKLFLYEGDREDGWDCPLWIRESCFIKRFGHEPTYEDGFNLTLKEHLGKEI